jgi:hypothetical protein
MYRSALIAALGVLFLAGPAFAQVCDPKKEICCDPKTEICDSTTCDSTKDVCADCSPGYYKNHVEAWCAGDPATSLITCEGIGTVTCLELRNEWLDASMGATAGERALAKACLDAYFGTAEASPCEDDD